MCKDYNDFHYAQQVGFVMDDERSQIVSVKVNRFFIIILGIIIMQ